MAVLASAALALAAAGAARAGGRSAPPSGKAGGHAENGSAQVAHLHGKKSSGVECPPELKCQFLPAAYAQNSSSPYDYGNYDLADRPADGLAIRYVVVHDTEEGYDSTLAEFQDSHAYVSAHYVIRSSDGLVTQMVPTKDVAWHAGNWYVNTHSVGIENEGFAMDGAQWFTPKLYRSLARLTRYQAHRFGLPLNRAHVIGHDQVPGPSSPYQAGMHWDPGPFFDWARLMRLAGAPIRPQGAPGADPIVTIDPAWRTNKPTVTGCGDGTATVSEAVGELRLPPHCSQLQQPARLRPVPDGRRRRAGRRRDDARVGLGRQGLDRRGVRRRRPSRPLARGLVRRPEGVAARSAGQRCRDHSGDRHADHAEGGSGVDPGLRRGVSLQLLDGDARQVLDSAGQTYVAKDLVTADHYSASTFDDPSSYFVQTSPEQFYEIFFNHRIAYVRADDVNVVR